MPATRFHIAIVFVAACKQPPREEAPPVPDYTLEYHEPTVLVDKQPGPSSVAVDATHVYWTHFGKPLVRRMPRAGGPVETVFEGTSELGGCGSHSTPTASTSARHSRSSASRRPVATRRSSAS